jgi:hypothetical protein
VLIEVAIAAQSGRPVRRDSASGARSSVRTTAERCSGGRPRTSAASPSRVTSTSPPISVSQEA